MTVNINHPIFRSTALRPLRSLRVQQRPRNSQSTALRPLRSLRVQQRPRKRQSMALRPLRSLREI